MEDLFGFEIFKFAVVSEDSARISWPLSSANKAQTNLFRFLEIFKARKFSIGYFEG